MSSLVDHVAKEQEEREQARLNLELKRQKQQQQKDQNNNSNSSCCCCFPCCDDDEGDKEEEKNEKKKAKSSSSSSSSFAESYVTFLHKYRYLILCFWFSLIVVSAIFVPSYLQAGTLEFTPPEGTKARIALNAKHHFFANRTSDMAVVVYLENTTKQDPLPFGIERITDLPSVKEFTTQVNLQLDFTALVQNLGVTIGSYYFLNDFAAAGLASSLLATPHENAVIMTLVLECHFTTTACRNFAKSVVSITEKVAPSTLGNLTLNKEKFKGSKSGKEIQLTHEQAELLSTKLLQAGATGMPSLVDSFITQIQNDVTSTSSICLPIALVLFCFTLQSIRFILLPVVSLILSLGISCAIMYGVSFVVAINSASTAMMLVVSISASVDWSVFLGKRFISEIRAATASIVTPQQMREKAKDDLFRIRAKQYALEEERFLAANNNNNSSFANNSASVGGGGAGGSNSTVVASASASSPTSPASAAAAAAAGGGGGSGGISGNDGDVAARRKFPSSVSALHGPGDFEDGGEDEDEDDDDGCCEYSDVTECRCCGEIDLGYEPVIIAVSNTLSTAGVTVFVSGLTLAVAFSALVFFPVDLLISLGASCMSVICVSLLVSLNLAPTLLLTFFFGFFHGGCIPFLISEETCAKIPSPFLWILTHVGFEKESEYDPTSSRVLLRTADGSGKNDKNNKQISGKKPSSSAVAAAVSNSVGGNLISPPGSPMNEQEPMRLSSEKLEKQQQALQQQEHEESEEEDDDDDNEQYNILAKPKKNYNAQKQQQQQQQQQQKTPVKAVDANLAAAAAAGGGGAGDVKNKNNNTKKKNNKKRQEEEGGDDDSEEEDDDNNQIANSPGAASLASISSSICHKEALGNPYEVYSSDTSSSSSSSDSDSSDTDDDETNNEEKKEAKRIAKRQRRKQKEAQAEIKKKMLPTLKRSFASKKKREKVQEKQLEGAVVMSDSKLVGFPPAAANDGDDSEEDDDNNNNANEKTRLLRNSTTTTLASSASRQHQKNSTTNNNNNNNNNNNYRSQQDNLNLLTGMTSEYKRYFAPFSSSSYSSNPAANNNSSSTVVSRATAGGKGGGGGGFTLGSSPRDKISREIISNYIRIHFARNNHNNNNNNNLHHHNKKKNNSNNDKKHDKQRREEQQKRKQTFLHSEKEYRTSVFRFLEPLVRSPFNFISMLLLFGLIGFCGAQVLEIKIEDATSAFLARKTTAYHSYVALQERFSMGAMMPYRLMFTLENIEKQIVGSSQKEENGVEDNNNNNNNKTATTNYTVFEKDYIDSYAHYIIQRIVNETKTPLHLFRGIYAVDGKLVNSSEIQACVELSSSSSSGSGCTSADVLFLLLDSEVVNPSKTAADLLLIAPIDPTGPAGTSYYNKLLEIIQDANFYRGNPHDNAKNTRNCYLLGLGAETIDAEKVVFEKFPYIGFFAIVATLVTCGVSFKSFLLPFRLLISIGISQVFVFGVCVLVYQKGDFSAPYQNQVLWLSPIVVFCFCLGICLDFGIFINTRVGEILKVEKRDPASATIRALCSTGGVITSAALIMIAAFSGLALSEIPVISQIGILLCVAVFFDSFISRLVFDTASIPLTFLADNFLMCKTTSNSKKEQDQAKKREQREEERKFLKLKGKDRQDAVEAAGFSSLAHEYYSVRVNASESKNKEEEVEDGEGETKEKRSKKKKQQEEGEKDSSSSDDSGEDNDDHEEEETN